MITRRALTLAAAAAVPLVASAKTRPSLLDRAIARAGGAAALSRVGVLRWTGTAKIFAGPRIIEIGASTTVRPFRGARSDTWLLTDGPSKARSLIIEGDQGWTERGGAREPLPVSQARHEAMQYALYGLMLLTPLREPRARFTVDEARREITADYPGAPRTVLAFDSDFRLAGAHNVVPSPEAGAASIRQDIRFEGEITSAGGVRWPRKVTIDQNGNPYFELTLTTFDAGPA